MFLAIDLAERVCVAALGGDEADVSSPGWPIRMPLKQMHAWLCNDKTIERDGQAELVRCVERWRVPVADVALVVLSKIGREEACRLAGAIGCSQVCIPRYRYMISPRGVVPAGILWDYSHQMASPGWDWQAIRNSFVDLLEKAADDVQRAKFEQDDSVVDRYAELRWAGSGEVVLLPVESLSDPQWLLSNLRETAQLLGKPVPADTSVEVLSLHMRCAVELPEMFPRRIAESDDRLERAMVPINHTTAEGSRFNRELLLAGDGGDGPATILEAGLAISIDKGWIWRVNKMGQLICRLTTKS